MSRVEELKRQYGQQKDALQNELATLAYRARQVDVSMSNAARDRLGLAEFNQIQAAEGEAFAENERQRLKAEWMRLDMELAAAVEEARIVAEQELAPQSVSAQDIFKAHELSEEDLIGSMDSAATLGEAGTDVIKVAFLVARTKQDYDRAVAHALELMPDLVEAYRDIVEASSAPDIEDADERFELIAAPAPSKEVLLRRASMSDVDTYGMMR